MTVNSRSSVTWRQVLGIVAPALCALVFVTSSASAADSWTCTSSAGSECPSGYKHHSIGVMASYGGSGNLPLGAGSKHETLNYNLFASYSGDWNPPHYNQVTACAYFAANGVTCQGSTRGLGRAWVSNRNPSTHTIGGYDAF